MRKPGSGTKAALKCSGIGRKDSPTAFNTLYYYNVSAVDLLADWLNETDSEKTPFVGREMTPKIAGVLVIAEGGENTAVKQNISEAVMALFQIDVNRIKVVKMNIQEDER